MLGIRYLKAPATTFVLHYKNGKVVRRGTGLSFVYFAPTSVLVQVPVTSVDMPFAFTETSGDFQHTTVQGSLTYRIVDAERLAGLLDYTVNQYGVYKSDDPSKVGERLIQTTQTAARSFIQSQKLRTLLTSSSQLVIAILEAMKASETVQQLGVEVLDVSVGSIKADPEMAKALQAAAREQLLKEADVAIYARRNASVELERTIKENEFKTEIIVAEKQRTVRETKMAGEISVEEQRSKLVETKATNERKEAEAFAGASPAGDSCSIVRELDWRMLLALQGDAHAGTLISSAFEQLAQKAEKIGQLNITPDLLQSLLPKQATETPTAGKSHAGK